MRLDEVSRNYDIAAKYYDPLTEIVFERLLRLKRYRRRTIDLLGDINGATVLDVGCGTGRNFPILMNRIGERGKIIGIDYSEGMLEQARRCVESQSWRNIDLVRGDAVTLDAISASVDAVTSAWCMGILYDLDKALIQAVEVLRPGGRLSIMDFRHSHPDHGPLKWLFPVYGFLLTKAGIDTAEDLDDELLREKWEHGCQILKSHLNNVHVEHYLTGTGLIVAGQKPG